MTVLLPSPEPAEPRATPNPVAPARGLLTDDQPGSDAHAWRVVGDSLDRGQVPCEALKDSAPVDPSDGRARLGPTPKVDSLVRQFYERGIMFDEMAPGFAALRLWAEMYTDVQSERIRIGNRIGSATVDPMPYLIHLDVMKVAEHKIGLDLVRTYRKVTPLAIVAWQKSTMGVGEHMLARLLGSLGHPRLAVSHAWADNPKFNADEPSSTTNPKRLLVVDGEPFERTVGQLWQYCGHGSPERKRKGMTQDDALRLGSPRCKMLVHLIAEACLKSGGYRDVYDATKAHYLAKEFTKGHAHNCALRKMGKEMLRDLWRAAEVTA